MARKRRQRSYTSKKTTPRPRPRIRDRELEALRPSAVHRPGRASALDGDRLAEAAQGLLDGEQVAGLQPHDLRPYQPPAATESGSPFALEGLFDLAVEALATVSAFERTQAALRPGRRRVDIGPRDQAVTLLVRCLNKLRTPEELRDLFSADQLQDMSRTLWAAVCRYAEAFARGFGDAARLRLLRKKAADWHDLFTRDMSASEANRLIASVMGMPGESAVRKSLLKPAALKNRLGLEDSEPRALAKGPGKK